MTYLIRSLKYFVTMSVFAIILIVLMILTGFATVNLYEPGSAWRFVVLFGAIAVISLFHPKMTRTVRYVAATSATRANPSSSTHSAKPTMNWSPKRRGS